MKKFPRLTFKKKKANPNVGVLRSRQPKHNPRFM